MLHLPRLLRRSTEKENAAGQSVEPVYRPQVLQVVLLGENEHDRVVAVPPARVHLQSQYPRDLFAEKTALEAGEERDGGMIGLKIPNGVREKRARIIVLLYLRKSISGFLEMVDLFLLFPPRLFLFAPCLLFKKKFSLHTRKIRGVISIHVTYRPIKSN